MAGFWYNSLMLFAFAILAATMTQPKLRHGVKAHLAIAFDRLGASSHTEAASLALSLGLI